MPGKTVEKQPVETLLPRRSAKPPKTARQAVSDFGFSPHIHREPVDDGSGCEVICTSGGRTAAIAGLSPRLTLFTSPAALPIVGVPVQDWHLMASAGCPGAEARNSGVIGPLRNIHLISDSTGDTLHAAARAALAAFPEADPKLHLSVFVRTDEDLTATLGRVRDNPGLVLLTMADPGLRGRLSDECDRLGMPVLAPLDPVIAAFSALFGTSPEFRPGRQHRLNSNYFSRITALDYAIALDDGALGERLMLADVILTGVSRTSKTPTCIFLAHRGIKAANVPLVPRTSPPQALFDALGRDIPVIGLTASPGRLAQVRQVRLHALGANKTADYAEIEQIRTEVADARLLFERHHIPVIDVTRRSIEETAAEILAHLRGLGRALP